jgi:hypothetical protein
MARPDMSYGPPPRAAGLLGQARPQTPTHVRVPISTLVSLLLAEAPKPVMPRSQPMQRPAPRRWASSGCNDPPCRAHAYRLLAVEHVRPTSADPDRGVALQHVRSTAPGAHAGPVHQLLMRWRRGRDRRGLERVQGRVPQGEPCTV